MNPPRRLLRRATSIRVRLTLWYVALLAVILLAFSLVLWLSLSRSLREELDLSLSTEAERLITSMDFENGAPHLAEGPDNLRIGTVAALYDTTGTHVLAYDPRQPLPALPDALSRAAQGQATFDTASFPDGAQWRVLTTPVSENGFQIGILQVGRPIEAVDATLRQLALLLAFAVPLTLLVASAGGLFLAGRALNPIDRITRAAAAISANDLSRRLNFRGSRDEVGRLAATFDRMLDRLDGAFRRQQQFTADASHELRTPLTMLSSQIDVALERKRSLSEYEELLRSLREDAQRMTQLVSELLTLARADAGQQLLSQEELDLGDLVRSVVEAMQPLAVQRGVDLTEHIEPHITISGDQTRLTQLVINLVDNALRYTLVGGQVRVEVTPNDAWAEVRVKDTGVGIAAEHLAHLFERFYRADPSRARSDGGTGLGLAIAKWTAQAHGGEISVASELGQGSTFTVRLPLSQPVPVANSANPQRVSVRS
ncbi:MAG TPA: heavy metal sensor histidine kinase [Chloroflexota bacterium]|nr:heavy metal sensor histidine kinase [Chloroflexota bacterium]